MTVPSTVVEPLKVSVTVTVLLVSVVGVPKAKPAVPVAEPWGVEYVELFQVAVAVFSPLAGFGAEAYAQL